MNNEFVSRPRPRSQRVDSHSRPSARIADRSRLRGASNAPVPIEKAQLSQPSSLQVPKASVPKPTAQPTSTLQPVQKSPSASKIRCLDPKFVIYENKKSGWMSKIDASFIKDFIVQYKGVSLVSAVAAILILVGLFQVLSLGVGSNSAGSASIGASGGNKSTAGETVAESQPSSTTINSYETSPNKPKYLRIPIHGLKAKVIEKKDLNFPDNTYDVAWFGSSLLPGEKVGSGKPEASLLMGYDYGKTGAGAFATLGKLLPNDFMQIVLGDDSSHNYKVIKVETMRADQLDPNKLLKSVESGKPGLNLITKTLDSGAAEHQNVTVVFAVQQ